MIVGGPADGMQCEYVMDEATQVTVAEAHGGVLLAIPMTGAAPHATYSLYVRRPDPLERRYFDWVNPRNQNLNTP